MSNKTVKRVYIDFYHPIFEEDGLTPKELIHLNSMDIDTDIDIREVVSQMKQRIFEHYGDGLYILAEEFKTICYLNVIIMFGKKHNFLVEYLDSIKRIPSHTAELAVSKTKMFLSVNYFEEDEYEEILSSLKSMGIESEIYLIERRAFERGAGDYHENIILSLITGAVEAISYRVTNVLLDKLGERHNPRISRLNNNDQILSYISKETGINIQDLNIIKIENISDEIIEINITSRYKSIKVVHDKNSNNINYEIVNKTQTMI